MSRFQKQEMVLAISKSNSIKEVIQNLGLNINSGNYRAIHTYANEHSLVLPKATPDTNAATSRNTISNEDWFVAGIARNGQRSKKRLIALGWLDACSECHIGNLYNGKPLTIQTDHIDGDHFNNLISNLRLLCPNCHSQTDTYSNNSNSTAERYSYCSCGVRLPNGSAQCTNCS